MRGERRGNSCGSSSVEIVRGGEALASDSSAFGLAYLFVEFPHLLRCSCQVCRLLARVPHLFPVFSSPIQSVHLNRAPDSDVLLCSFHHHTWARPKLNTATFGYVGCLVAPTSASASSILLLCFLLLLPSIRLRPSLKVRLFCSVVGTRRM